MPITRNSDQGAVTLEAFYLEVVEREQQQQPALIAHYPGVGQSMLRLTERINELFKGTQLWGLTSLYRLVVQRSDDWTSPWHVILAASGIGDYYIEYLLPTAAQPWPGATVHGEAQTLAEAERYLLIAMRESGGWADNSELDALLEGHELRS